MRFVRWETRSKYSYRSDSPPGPTEHPCPTSQTGPRTILVFRDGGGGRCQNLVDRPLKRSRRDFRRPLEWHPLPRRAANPPRCSTVAALSSPTSRGNRLPVWSIRNVYTWDAYGTSAPCPPCVIIKTCTLVTVLTRSRHDFRRRIHRLLLLARGCVIRLIWWDREKRCRPSKYSFCF